MKKALVISALCLFLLTLLQPTFLALQQKDRGVGIQQQAQTERRVALVIGNGAYQDGPLANPPNDARDMAAALRRLGFDVIEGENLNQKDMDRNIRLFGTKIRGGSVGLFYYAGHGIQINGINYLIPVGANITMESEVKYESIDVGLVLAQMDNARNSLNIVILDACRNNPFARSFRSASQGLASIDAPRGTLIAYATAPGSTAKDGTGKNGTYTEELLRYIRTPGLSIEQVFKRVRVAVVGRTNGFQTPWESSSLVGDFYFSGSKGSTTQATTTSTEPTAVSRLLNTLADSNVEIIDTVSVGRDHYVFYSERINNGRWLANPDGIKFLQCDLAVARIDNQQNLQTLKLGSIYGFNTFEAGTNIGFARTHGAIDLNGNEVMAFAIEKSESNNYGMAGHVFRIDTNNFTLIKQEMMYSDSNMGWFPVIKNGSVTHFSFAAYCYMRGTQQLENTTLPEAIATYSSYRYNKIAAARDRDPAQYQSAAAQFIATWQQ